MAFDVPKLGGYTITNPPESMLIVPEVVQQVNELADGGTRQRILGYRHRITLSWSDNWIRSQDLTGLMAVANDASATLSFIPRSVTKASLTYTVLWTNKFNFTMWNGKYDVWNGSIELITPSVTATVTNLP